MTILKASEGWIQEELALLQVMFLEIIGFNRDEKLHVLSANTILESFLQPSDDVMSEVFSLADLQKARDAARLQHPEAFATLDELGVFIEWGIHPFFHHAAALRWNEPVLETMESLRSTYFYQIHGLVDLWRAKWVKAH